MARVQYTLNSCEITTLHINHLLLNGSSLISTFVTVCKTVSDLYKHEHLIIFEMFGLPIQCTWSLRSVYLHLTIIYSLWLEGWPSFWCWKFKVWEFKVWHWKFTACRKLFKGSIFHSFFKFFFTFSPFFSVFEAVLKSGSPSYGKYWRLKFHFRDFKSHGSLDFLANGLKKLRTFV